MEEYKQDHYQLNNVIKGLDVALTTKANKTELLIMDEKKFNKTELQVFLENMGKEFMSIQKQQDKIKLFQDNIQGMLDNKIHVAVKHAHKQIVAAQDKLQKNKIQMEEEVRRESERKKARLMAKQFEQQQTKPGKGRHQSVGPGVKVTSKTQMIQPNAGIEPQQVQYKSVDQDKLALKAELRDISKPIQQKCDLPQ